MGDRARLFAIGVLLNTGERVHDIGRREIAAIVELDALLKLEHPSVMVRIAPRLGENRNNLFLAPAPFDQWLDHMLDRKSTRLNSSHVAISYAVFCLKK